MTEQASTVRRLDDGILARHADVFGASPQVRAVALARALATSPRWEQLRHQAALVVRQQPQPILGILGEIPAEDLSFIHSLGWHVDSLLARLRPMDYLAVETACIGLAEQLEDLLGAERISTCRLVGVPRGGLVVAGLLAYALGLSGQQVGVGTSQHQGPLIVVDDCVISGSRLRRWLREHEGDSLILAHLASVPACRKAILAEETRVAACVAAVDLEDHTRDDGDDSWRTRWAERSPDDYWTGESEHVVFPWNEPDASVWNPARGQADAAWRVIPPSWCLKNRIGTTDAAASVQVLPATAGPIAPADDVLWATIDGSVLIAAMSGDRSVRLRGVAAASWHSLIELGDAEATAAALARRYSVGERRVHRDLAKLVTDLTARGLLVT